MGNSNSNVKVDITADVSGFNSGAAEADAKLKQLAASFDKTGQAARAANEPINAVEASANKLGAAISIASKAGLIAGAGFAAAGAAAFALAKGAIDAADELHNLHLQTGIAVERLAGWDVVTKQSNTSVSSLAQELKSASNYMVDHGDKLQAMGIHAKTSEELLFQLAGILSRLPADDPRRVALAMDVLGNSAQDLLPLLSEGEAGLRAMLERGMELNPITAEMAKEANLFNSHLVEFNQLAKQFGIGIATYMLPNLNDLLEQMLEGQKTAGGFWSALFQFGTMNPFRTPEESIKSYREEIAGLQKDRERFLGMNAPTTSIDMAIEGLQKKLKFAEFMQRQGTSPASKPEGLSVAEQAYLDPYIPTGTPKATKPRRVADPNASAVAQIQMEAFRAEMELMGVSAEQVKVYEMAMKGATDEQIRNAQAAADAITPIKAEMEARKQAKKGMEQAERDHAKAVEDANKIIYDIDPMAKLQAEWEKLNALKEQGLLTDEQAGRAYQKTFKDMSKSGKDSFAELSRAIDGWGKKASETFIDFAFTGKASVSDLISHMAREFATMQAYNNIFQPVFSAGGDLFGDLLGGMFGGGGGSSMAGSGSANDVLAAMGANSFAGGGYTGSGSRSGGIDGMGGFPAILHPNETVIDHARGQSGGGVVVQNNIQVVNAPGTASQIEQRPNNTGGMDIAIIIEQIEGGIARNVSRGTGALNGALTQTFGLNRGAGALR
jgi:hypothetical protein